MDDLYDEFGNFIGEEAEASEEESVRGVDAGNYAYDDDYPEEAPEATGQELMEIDGK
jgi:116 kDa U5 small nuclear ribonucleoprotein component